jgi:ribosomal protein L11 methyltransferase
MSPRDGWKAEFDTTLDLVPALEGAIEALTPDDPPTFTSFEVDEKARHWKVEVYFATEPNEAALEQAVATAARTLDAAPPELVLAPIESRDWVAESQRQLRPIHAGRFFVHGSHARNAIPEGLIALEIDAGQAFGTGTHETTHGCLLALTNLARRFKPTKILDVGCGSGILALAAWHLWRCPAFATDIDPIAIKVASENAALNGVPVSPPAPDRNTLRLATGAGLNIPLVRQNKPFDLILANILMKPLCALAPEITAALSPRGKIVLSGLLNSQAPAVLNAYRIRGLILEDKIVLGQWTTLVMTR